MGSAWRAIQKTVVAAIVRIRAKRMPSNVNQRRCRDRGCGSAASSLESGMATSASLTWLQAKLVRFKDGSKKSSGAALFTGSVQLGSLASQEEED